MSLNSTGKDTTYVADRDRLLHSVDVSRARCTDHVEAPPGRNRCETEARALRLCCGKSHGPGRAPGSRTERYGTRKLDYGIESLPRTVERPSRLQRRHPCRCWSLVLNRRHSLLKKVTFQPHRSYNGRLPLRCRLPAN